MKPFKPSDETVVQQLNASNNRHITKENIGFKTVNNKPSIVGDNVKYGGDKDLVINPRNLRNYGDTTLLLTTTLPLGNGTFKVKDLLSELNAQTTYNFVASDFSNSEELINEANYGRLDRPSFAITFKANGVTFTNYLNVVFVLANYKIATVVDKIKTKLLTPDNNNALQFVADKNNFGCTVDFESSNPVTASLSHQDNGPGIYFAQVKRRDKLNLQFLSSTRFYDPLAYNFEDTTVLYAFFTFNTGWYWSGVQVPKEAVNVSDLIPMFIGTELRRFNTQNILEGHELFLKNNTGRYTDPHVDRFVINDQDVIVNNRHFTYNTRQEGQPDSDATTEGHSILIIGYIEQYKMYEAIGNTAKANEALAKAEKYFNSYITAFYGNVQPPDTPQRWPANWIVNGKAPVLAHYPLAPSNEFPTHGGFKDIDMQVTNGVINIPHGAPYWGEYLDVVGAVYKGKLGWATIGATPYATLSDGSIDWNTKTPRIAIEKVYCWSGEIISGTGDFIDNFADESLKGRIVLADKTLNGTYQVAFAPRVPVEHGGYLIQTNECQHNRPIQVPVTADYRGNASDAEQWFCEAAYELWMITGKDIYQKAYRSSEFSIMDYSMIDSNDKFFRRVIGSVRYDTDGIAYHYTYPSKQPITFGRDSEGNITATTARAEGCQITLEQQAIWFRVNRKSVLEIDYGGEVGTPVRAQLYISPDKADNTRKPYTITLPATKAGITHIELPIGSLVDLSDPTADFELGDVTAINWMSATTTAEQKFETAVVDGRTASVLAVGATGTGMQCVMGFTKKRPVTKVFYRANIDMNIRVTDDNNWRWWAMLPNTNGVWSSVTLTTGSWTLSGYQPDHTDTDVRPTTPTWPTGVDEASFLPDNDSDANTSFGLAALNSLPPTYSKDDGYTMLFNITFYLAKAGTALLGDCTIKGQRLDPLPYTPGIIPFSNNYVPNAPTFDSWRGQPYPGYQYPFYYVVQNYTENPNQGTMIQNVCQFLYDSQVWYHDRFGIWGPGASAYVWDRWDRPDGETPNTWTMYHFGDSTAWSGYQPRAFYSAVRLYEELKAKDMPIPTTLTSYINNWLTYLRDFVKANRVVPTDFPMEGPPVAVHDDFTGHMSGLYLAGICKSWMLGYRIDGHLNLAKQVYDEIVGNYIQRCGFPDKMNGGWSPWGDPDNNGRNGMYYGFWSGELMRGIALYETMMQKVSKHPSELPVIYPKRRTTLFKPMYWKINGPSTESFSTISKGDILHVTMVCRTTTGLCGLRWVSEDKGSHKGLAYEKRPTYAGTKMRFSVTVSGNTPDFSNVDNAPTLTVNHSDKTVQYIPLYRYATISNNGKTALIEIDFDTVRAGFDLTETVRLDDIDEMFFSIVSNHYREGVAFAPLPTPETITWDMKFLPVDQSVSSMRVGNLRVAPHDIGMCTSYDDLYHLSPERVVHDMYMLGYRGLVDHYVGMSHYYHALWHADLNGWRVDTTTPLNAATVKWHEAFYEHLKRYKYEVVNSVSWELMSTVCPPTWVQQDWDSNPAATGYTPPSWLISPSSTEGIGYIKSIMLAFSKIANDKGLVPNIQMGEPWWWYNVATKRPCIYDYPTKLAFNQATGLYAEDIGTYDKPNTSPTITAYIDFVRKLLGDKVLECVRAVKAVYPTAKTTAMPFLPSIIGMGVMEQINLPTAQYSNDNLDIYFTECYDWLLKGELNRSLDAVTIPMERMGWAPSKIHYLSGFVPDPVLAPIYGFDPEGPWIEDVWKLIVGSINLMAQHYPGVRNYIWAYPQVMTHSLVVTRSTSKWYTMDGKWYKAADDDLIIGQK